MPNVNFENDKYIPTPLPEICAPRQELLKLFESAADKRLTVICAPAGYGKTVSALLWIKASGRRSVWIGLDEYDNAPFVFYKLFCNGIRSVQPDNEKMSGILNSKAFDSSPVEHTINLLAEFAQDGQPYALILDDLHTISDKQILKSLPYILKRMPHSFHILLLSRYALSEEMEALTVDRGNLITSKELAFSTNEIRGYYDALGLSITKAQARSVFEATGGWAIGINALSKNENFDSVQIGGHLLENYINKNIWEKWDPELREFMLTTSVLDEMNAELCKALTARKNAAEYLDKQVFKNLFVVKTSGTTYRYHHLFSEFLHTKRKECPDINVKALTLKAADWYYKECDFFTALTYYVCAEDSAGIERCFFQLNSGYHDFSVEEWVNYFTVFVFNKLPETFICENISLVIEAVYANYLNGNAEALLRYIDLVNEYIESEQNFDRMRDSDLLGFICSIRFTDFRKSLYEYTEEFSEWVKAMPDQADTGINIYMPSLTQNFPFMHRSFCDCLEIVMDMDNRLQSIRKVFGTLFGKEAETFCICVQAGLYYEQNKLDKANETFQLMQSWFSDDIRLEMRFCISMIKAQILGAVGNQEEAEKERVRFAEHMKAENALYLNPNFLAVDIKNRLWDADRDAANEWLEQLFVTDDEQFRFYKLYQYFTTARAFVVLSEPEKAAKHLEKLKKLCCEYHRPLDIAEAGVLLSVLQWAIGSQNEAEQSMEEVLLAMQPYRAIRIISDEGAAVLPILKKITVNIDKADYEGQLDKHYLNQVTLCAYEVSKSHKGITAHINQKSVKLSKQQKYILTLLAQSYKNAEITEITGLSLNTIRSHTRILYQKLGVNKAADAVLEAKRRGIIES